MLIIDTYLKETKNKGIGLFTPKDIYKGTLIYMETPYSSKNVSNRIFKSYNKYYQKFIREYAFKIEKGYFLDYDNTRFMNHSSDPNIEFKEHYSNLITNSVGVCIKDIKAGEELTCDYLSLGIETKLGFKDKEDKSWWARLKESLNIINEK